MTPLAAAIFAMLTLENGHLVEHARHRGGPLFAERLAEQITTAATHRHLDPWLVAAVAFAESGFDGQRIGDVGELGVMQLHPRTPAGRAYAALCGPRRPQAECDRVAFELGATVLARALAACPSAHAALGLYRSGQCVEGPAGLRVLDLRAQLLERSHGVLCVAPGPQPCGFACWATRALEPPATWTFADARSALP
jgi:hypothetical protein